MLGSCAGQIAPSGGPRDIIPPSIISTYPSSNALNYSDSYFSFTFSEYVSSRSFEEAIFISPPIGKLIFDWSGTTVDVYFSQQLKPNVTYVITLGTDIVDINNNNQLKQTYSLAFSTGDNIDSSKISGKIFDTKPSGVFIFAYNLNNYFSDTLSPKITQPEYLTQTGTDGTFSLEHLAIGTYRVFAIRDKERNFLYDEETDAIGIATGDVILPDSVPFVSEIYFQLSKRDLAAPFILSAQAPHSSEIVITLSEPIDTTFLQHKVTIVDALTKIPLQVFNVFPDVLSLNKIFLQTEFQQNSKYTVAFIALKDTAGNSIKDELREITFEGSTAQDTAVPRVIFSSLKDSATEIECDKKLTFIFNTTINTDSLNEWFSFRDSADTIIQLEYEWKSPRAIIFSPIKKLSGAMYYSFNLFLNKMIAANGNKFSDSIAQFHFKTMDENIFGILKGKIILNNIQRDFHKIIVQAKNLEVQKALLRTTSTDVKGEFSFENLFPGNHILSAFYDEDENGKFSEGGIVPFIPSEFFTVHSDTVKVRSRWSVEGVTIKFK